MPPGGIHGFGRSAFLLVEAPYGRAAAPGERYRPRPHMSAAASGIDEAAAVVDLGAVLEGDVPDIPFGIAEAEAAPPARLIRLVVEIDHIIELANQLVRPTDRIGIFARDRHGDTAKAVRDATEPLLEDRLREQP